MPREGEVKKNTFHLYCTDPRDGVAKFQICAPKRAGEQVLSNDPRIHLENVTVTVDKEAQPFHERLELDVKINDDLILVADARSLNIRDQDCCEIHNLEFGLAFPADGQASTNFEENSVANEAMQEDPASHGSLSIRANMSEKEDPLLVPGELLYSFNPHYFDTRRNSPRIQEYEKLYYEPCSLCGKASNDPLCKCSSTLLDTQTHTT